MYRIVFRFQIEDPTLSSLDDQASTDALDFSELFWGMFYNQLQGVP